MIDKKFKPYRFCRLLLFIFFASISCVYASCSGLQIIDDWKWLDEPAFVHAKKAVFENYHSMAKQYCEWRNTSGLKTPDTFGTMAAKARIVFVNDSGVIEDVIEANHGRETLHVNPDKFIGSLPNPYHKTMFLPGEEDKYLNVLKNEEQTLRQYSVFCSWYSTIHFADKYPIVKDAVELYNKIKEERSFYRERIAERRNNVLESLKQVDRDLRKDLYEDGDKGGKFAKTSPFKLDQNSHASSSSSAAAVSSINASETESFEEQQYSEQGGKEERGKKKKEEITEQVFVYNDLHKCDAEAFACDNLFLQLDQYKLKNGVDKQTIRAFILFFTERDPCLCCSVTIKDYLSEHIRRKDLCSEIIPIVVSLDNYSERRWDKDETDIVIRDKIKTMPVSVIVDVDEDAQNLDDNEDQVTEPFRSDCILRLYRDESLRGRDPIYVAEAITGMFHREATENVYANSSSRLSFSETGCKLM